MLRFVKQILISGMMFFNCNSSNVNLLECVLMKNQECKIRPEIININSDAPTCYSYSIKTNKCSGSCNNINDPYAKMCILDVVKNLNIKAFNIKAFEN